MDNKTRKKLREILHTNVNNYENYSLVDEERVKGLNIIGKEVKLLNEDEKHTLELKVLNKRVALEELKIKNQDVIDHKKIDVENQKLELEKARLEIERSRLEIDNRRVDIEERKLELDVNLKNKEENKSKIDRWINVGLKIFEVGAPLIVFTSLTFWNFRLIYADDGRSPSELKDLMKNVLRK